MAVKPYTTHKPRAEVDHRMSTFWPRSVHSRRRKNQGIHRRIPLRLQGIRQPYPHGRAVDVLTASKRVSAAFKNHPILDGPDAIEPTSLVRLFTDCSVPWVRKKRPQKMR